MSTDQHPTVNPRPTRSAPMSNRRQMLLFAMITVILSAAAVWGGRMLLQRSETVIFAVGAPGGVEARFAAKLADVLKANGSHIRLKIEPQGDNSKALAQIDKRFADLAILRTDAKIPIRARSLAILEHDLLVVISPKDKKIETLADLKRKKSAVVGDADDMAFVRRSLDVTDNSEAAGRIQPAPANTPIDKLLAKGSGYGAVILVTPASRYTRSKEFEQAAARAKGFTINALDQASIIARKFPEIFEEKIETGMLSQSPQIPDDDLDTVGLQWLLIAQSKLSTSVTGELARIIYENKSALALDDGFASKIEPADTDKDAFVIAHPGAAEYINDEMKSFMERYSDTMYLAAAALSVIGSIFAGLYAKFTRIPPETASKMAADILDIGERLPAAQSMEALDALQDELEKILRDAVRGLHDGAIHSDGLETFKLGYELVRDDIAMRRDILRRHGGSPETVAIVRSSASG